MEEFHSDNDTEIDICSQKPNICVDGAGCRSKGRSYECLCTIDLKPADPKRGCSREKVVNKEPIPTQFNTFESKQLLDMINRHNGNNGNQRHNATNFSHGSALGSHYLPTILFVVFSILIIASALVSVYFWRQRRRWFLINSCFKKGRRADDYAGSLAKCRQQYLTNPNYYSSSPDGSSYQNLRDMEIPRDALTFLEVIGEGCFGKVHKGVYIPSEEVEVPVAIKILKEGTSLEIQADFEREVEIISSFKHENILKLLGVVIKETDKIPWMVFEYMMYGDLAELLRSNNPILPRPTEHIPYRLQQSDLLKIAKQIANGMMYLSSQHFVHRDLATRNCLVGENLTVKISDFGMTRDIYTSDYYKIGGSRMLPIRWMAPESITYGKFSLESDVWSYGVVLWEIYTFGKQPYCGHSNEEVVRQILQGTLLRPPEGCSPFVCEIMAGCWRSETKRLTFPEIYNILVTKDPDRGRQVSSDDDERESDKLLDEDNYLVPRIPSMTVI